MSTNNIYGYLNVPAVLVFVSLTSRVIRMQPSCIKGQTCCFSSHLTSCKNIPPLPPGGREWDYNPVLKLMTVKQNKTKQIMILEAKQTSWIQNRALN